MTTTDQPRLELAGFLLCATLAVVWAWWAWQEGAYFGVVLLPGGIVLCAALLLFSRVVGADLDLRPTRPAGLALWALVGLGLWTALSALWSPAPGAALADAQQVLIYAVAFGLGLWLAALLGPRLRLSLVPLAFAGAFGAGAVVVTLLMGDRPDDYLNFGNLQYPFGYRNANAAFFLIAAFPALGLAADRELDWRLRGAALGVTTLCLDVALLSQSRGSIPASVIAVAVYVLAAPLRVRAISWLILGAACALGVLPAATDLFETVNDNGPSAALDQLRAAGVAMLITGGVATVIGLVAARFEGRVPGLGSTTPRLNRAVLAGLAGLVVVAFAAFVVKVGDPIEWAGDRVDEFGRGGAPDVSQSSSRFVISLQSDRNDLWATALDDAGDDPVLGSGGGGFQYTYTRKREAELQTARDAHSIELEVFSELGAVGLALLLAALGGITVALLRARRLEGPAAGVAAIAMAAGAYWLAHSSIDWFFHFPALTAPTMALLGSACAATASRPGQPRGTARGWVAAAAVLLAITLVPPYLSERYVNDAYAGWRSDLERAYDDLDRAASLDRFSDAPLLAEGGIAQAAGDSERAISAFQEAADRVPDEWATHYLLAELYATTDPRLARQELETARRLNPLSEDVRQLARALDDPARLERFKRTLPAPGQPAEPLED